MKRIRKESFGSNPTISMENINETKEKLSQLEGEMDQCRDTIKEYQEELIKSHYFIELSTDKKDLLKDDLQKQKDYSKNLKEEIEFLKKEKVQKHKITEQEKKKAEKEFEIEYQNQSQQIQLAMDKLEKNKVQLLDQIEYMSVISQQQQHVCLIIDTSGSMEDYISKIKDEIKQYILNLMVSVENNIFISLIIFNDTASSIIKSTHIKDLDINNFDKYLNFQASGGTIYRVGFQHLLEILISQQETDDQQFIIFFTDGEDNENTDDVFKIVSQYKNYCKQQQKLLIRGFGSFQKKNIQRLNSLSRIINKQNVNITISNQQFKAVDILGDFNEIQKFFKNVSSSLRNQIESKNISIQELKKLEQIIQNEQTQLLSRKQDRIGSAILRVDQQFETNEEYIKNLILIEDECKTSTKKIIKEQKELELTIGSHKEKVIGYQQKIKTIQDQIIQLEEQMKQSIQQINEEQSKLQAAKKVYYEQKKSNYNNAIKKFGFSSLDQSIQFKEKLDQIRDVLKKIEKTQFYIVSKVKTDISFSRNLLGYITSQINGRKREDLLQMIEDKKNSNNNQDLEKTLSQYIILDSKLYTKEQIQRICNSQDELINLLVQNEDPKAKKIIIDKLVFDLEQNESHINEQLDEINKYIENPEENLEYKEILSEIEEKEAELNQAKETNDDVSKKQEKDIKLEILNLKNKQKTLIKEWKQIQRNLSAELKVVTRQKELAEKQYNFALEKVVQVLKDWESLTLKTKRISIMKQASAKLKDHERNDGELIEID